MSDFFNEDYWNVAYDPQRPIKSFLIKTFRIILSSVRGFNRDECSLRASALTFYTMLSIVPVLAVAFGIAKGFGLEAFLERQLMAQFYEQKEFVNKAIEFSYSLLKSTQGGVIAGIGVIVLLYTVLQVLSNIEDSFNAIWKVHQPRPLIRKITDYLAMMLLSPFFFVASSSLFVYAASHLAEAFQGNIFGKVLTPFVDMSFHIFPFLLTWFLFSFLYVFMPNTTVDLKSGFIAGLFAGAAYQIVQWIYIQFQIGVASYGAIYGSFAAIPLFLAWLYVSWLIILMGAEVAYHHQNDIRTRISSQGERCRAPKQVIGALITWACVQNFTDGNHLLQINDLANLAGINITTAQEIIDELIEKGLLAEVISGSEKDHGYQPAKERITLKNVIDALDTSRSELYYTTCSEKLTSLEIYLKSLDDMSGKCEANLSLRELKVL